MCHSRALNNKINKLHERALRVVYKDKSLTFEQMLERDRSFTIHQRNLQKLAIEMYKVKNGLRGDNHLFGMILIPEIDP